MAKSAKVEEKIEALRALVENAEKAVLLPALRRALKEKSNFLVAKAAQWSAEALCYEVIPDLVNTYERFLYNALETDKTCAAKRAITRALYDLDYDNVKFYRKGLRYIQLEPVYGGHVDTAVEVRCACALGLASTIDSRVMTALIELLHDEEHTARIGATRAMEMVDPYEAELLLRNKILQGDQEPEVIAQCFSSLMKVAAEEALEFTAAFLNNEDTVLSQSAALALGECRLDDALNYLIEKSDDEVMHNIFRRVLFDAIALQRTDKAFAYLLSIVENESGTAACDAIEALSIYNYNESLESSIKELLKQKNSTEISKVFQEFWSHS